MVQGAGPLLPWIKRIVLVVAVVLTGAGSQALSQQTPVPTFRSGREVLTVEASVRDGAGRPVTDLQPSDFLVSIDGQLPGKAKVIGMHVPPIGPYPDWSEADLMRGFKTYSKPLEARGPLTYRFEPAGGGQALKGHPLFAIRPAGDVYGTDAEYGSFRSARDTFIKELAKPSAGVQLRNDLLAVYVPSQSGKANLKSQYLVKSVVRVAPGQAGSAHSPQNYPRVAVDPRRLQDGRAPLYVNTTSAGPLGNYRPTEKEPRLVAPGYTYVELAASGVIEKVAFRFPVKPTAIGQRATAALVGAAK